MVEKNKNSLIIGVIVAITIIGAILIIYLSNQSSSYTGQTIDGQNCRDIETPYDVQEEYLKTEYYTETVPYEEEVYLEFTSTDSGASVSCSDFGNYKECYYVSVTNIDDKGGLFTVNCEFETLYRKLYDSQSLYINSGETIEFTCEADVDLSEDVKGTYTVTPPTKTIVKYKDVQREKQVTAYRPVTKYKTETVCE